jgi:hypothetical protein
VRHHHAVSHPAEQPLAECGGHPTTVGVVHDDSLRGGWLELAHDQPLDGSEPDRIRTTDL